MTEKHKPVFQGKIIKVSMEETRLPNGQTMELEMVHHPGGAAVVAIDDKNRVCLLRQFRVVVNGWLWELPAGKIDDEEPPLQTAQRELQEEAGVVATDWEELGKEISSPGIFNEQIYLYMARGLTLGQAKTEDHEVLEVHWIDFNEVITMIHDGHIQDAKTIIGLVLAKQIRDTGR